MEFKGYSDSLFERNYSLCDRFWKMRRGLGGGVCWGGGGGGGGWGGGGGGGGGVCVGGGGGSIAAIALKVGSGSNTRKLEETHPRNLAFGEGKQGFPSRRVWEGLGIAKLHARGCWERQ